MKNPYRMALRGLREELIGLTPEVLRGRPRPDIYAHWRADNEWINGHMANVLVPLAWLWQEDGGNDARLLPAIMTYFEQLLAACHGDRWFHNEPGMGDPNIDRFTLLPFCEAFTLVREALPVELRERILAQVGRILEVQLCEYGHGPQMKGGADRLYPNMDVYYCLCMLHGDLLLGDARWRTEWSRFVDRLGEAQFADGGWTYIDGTNECPVYHDLAVLLLGRLHQLTGDPRAMAQLTRSLPYYPLVCSPTGVPEYHTDCWWKHSWSLQRSFAPDVLASMSGDGRHRTLGDLTRPATLAEFGDKVSGRNLEVDNILGLFCVYAASAWREVEPSPLPTEQLVLDGNIEGPRGRFEEWSWAATARYGCDTLVGAMMHTAPDEPVCALMAVTPEIMSRHEEYPEGGMTRFAMAITPRGTRGHSRIDGETASFGVTYPMAAYRSVFGMEAFPYGWECTQEWELGRELLRGRIVWRSTVGQESPPTRLRLRFGIGKGLDQEADGSYRFGPYRLRVEAADLPFRMVTPVGVAVYLTSADCVELSLQSAEEWALGWVEAGQRYAATVEIRRCGE